jgi:cephalosporin hydroxylase
MNIAHIAHEAIYERGGQQKEEELDAVLVFLKAYFTRAPYYGQSLNMIEVGSHDAGALWAWGTVFDGAVGIDITDENVRQENLDEPRVSMVIGDSRSYEVADHALYNLSIDRDRLPDFIFIDANHHREEVFANYEFWRPYLAEGGIVGFHDIMVATEHGWRDVIESLPAGSTTIEFKHHGPQPMGIGLVITK